MRKAILFISKKLKTLKRKVYCEAQVNINNQMYVNELHITYNATQSGSRVNKY